jgi:hypothetical protein
MRTFEYNTDLYPFRQIVSEWFDVDNISKLHEIKKYNLFDREHDQSSKWHKVFYEKIREDNSFNELYVKFLTDFVKPWYEEEIVYQKIPTFRVHLVGNVAVGDWHKDRDYRNLNWAKKVKELNYYVPLTAAYNTNTIWAETSEDKKDFEPMEANYGECIEWGASWLTHGNKVNETTVSRVSFDFRVIPKSRYIDSNHLTINTKTPFNIGGYYEVL